MFKMTDPIDVYGSFLQKLSNNENFNMATYLKKFKKCKSNVQRMDFVYKDMERCKVFPPFVQDKKNDAVSEMHRLVGNELYKAGNYREAMDRYTQSILHAKSKEFLALAFANRSATFFKLDLHPECLTDIERALANGYPDNLKPKLIARRNFSKSQKTVKSKYHESLPQIPESEKNPKIQSARNCVKIMKNEYYGRYVVATRNIEVGEILAVEPPYTAIIKNEIYVHCHECFQLCYNMIPCDKCTKALYCSDACKDKALNAYHKYECPILSSLGSIFLDNPKRLALKTAFSSKNEWDKEDQPTGATDEEHNEVYRSDRFLEMCNLECHVDKRGAERLLARTAIACALFHLTEKNTKFLEDCVLKDRFKDILLLMLLVCGINTVDISELSRTLLGVYDLNPTGIAVYPFFTLFNHSCWPNVSRHFYGSTMVMRAMNTIKKGEQCFVCYGPNFVSYPKEFRQNFLKEHQFFTCTCPACEENWTTKNFKNVAGDLQMLQFLTMMKLMDADVNVAKEELKRLLVEAKKAERKLLPGRDYMVKDLLMLCYNVFGNKRRL